MSRSRDTQRLDELHVSLMCAWGGDDARMISRQIGILIFGKSFYGVMNSSLLDRA